MSYSIQCVHIRWLSIISELSVVQLLQSFTFLFIYGNVLGNFGKPKCCIERLLLLFNPIASFVLFYSNHRFNVNLLCGSRPDSANIALQLSSRFDTSWLIRNSKQSQEWGEEEGLAPRKFPFLPQVPFTVSIYTSPDAFLVRACLLFVVVCFFFSAYLARALSNKCLFARPLLISLFGPPTQIAIDGQHYCEYIHRQPYNLVDTLQIQGDVRISLIDFQFSQIYPPQPSVNRLNVVNPVIYI